MNQRKKTKRLAIIIIILTLIMLGAIGTAVYLKYILNDTQTELALAQEEMEANKKIVYIISTADGTGVKAGEILEENVNVKKQQVYSGLEDYNYMPEEDLGSTALVDMYEGMTVMANMVTPLSVSADTREYELQVVNLMVDQEEDDYIDVRIMFPDGTDFLVLSKKPVHNLNLENCVFWTYLNEEEILRMASATIDAFTITGTKIYATRYVESSLQEEATPNYLVNSYVRDMMDPTSSFYDSNLLTKAIDTLNASARASLEQRLGKLSDEKLEAVAEGHEISDTAKTSVLTGLGLAENGEENFDGNYNDDYTTEDALNNAAESTLEEDVTADTEAQTDETVAE